MAFLAVLLLLLGGAALTRRGTDGPPSADSVPEATCAACARAVVAPMKGQSPAAGHDEDGEDADAEDRERPPGKQRGKGEDRDDRRGKAKGKRD